MAIYHASTKPIARSAGRSAVAAAAYRSGERLIDARTGLVHDYTRKGGVVLAEAVLPNGARVERSALWNAAEVAEKRKDARTAREWIVALPAELGAGERAELARSFGAALAQRYGVAVDVAVHQPDRAGDNRNHHAHVMTTTRTVSLDATGVMILGEKASIELSDKARRARGMGPAADEVKAIRQLWEGMANAALERAGRAERIDCRTLAEQGIDREATTHLGPVATEMERRGVPSDRGDDNRQAVANNELRQKIKSNIVDLKAEREARELCRTDPAAVVQRWEEVYSAEYKRLRGRVQRTGQKILKAKDAQEQVFYAHRDQQPTPPRGIFKFFKQKPYERAKETWQKVHDHLEARLNQLGSRLGIVSRYGAKLDGFAQQKAEQKAPALARVLRQAREVIAAQQRQRRELERQQKQLIKRSRGRR